MAAIFESNGFRFCVDNPLNSMGDWPDWRRSPAMGGVTFSFLEEVGGVGVVADGLVEEDMLELDYSMLSC